VKKQTRKGASRAPQVLNEVPDAFNFTLVGEEQVSGKPAWVISAEPKPGYRAKERLAKVIEKAPRQDLGSINPNISGSKSKPTPSARFFRLRLAED